MTQEDALNTNDYKKKSKRLHRVEGYLDYREHVSVHLYIPQ